MSAVNLRDSQLAMAAHLRNPDDAPPPEGVEERRLKIYRDLIYKNVEGFISGGFPVLRSLYCDQDWHSLVRSFVDGHRCQSPYFLEISQEFIQYLVNEHETRECDPPFLAEMAHYEWVELALDVSTEELGAEAEIEQLRDAVLTLSPLAWVLAYQYPVHRIGPGFELAEPTEPTYLVVYRDRSDAVCFMELNAATARLLELLKENDCHTVGQVLETLATELQMSPEAIEPFALEQLDSLLQVAVIQLA